MISYGHFHRCTLIIFISCLHWESQSSKKIRDVISATGNVSPLQLWPVLCRICTARQKEPMFSEGFENELPFWPGHGWGFTRCSILPWKWLWVKLFPNYSCNNFRPESQKNWEHGVGLCCSGKPLGLLLFT